jgi:hypothetical protein
MPRVVIIGGDAAGMSAATRVRAREPDTDIVVLETSRFTSYSACGIPFVVGGLVAGGVEALVARSPDEHRRRGIDVRTNHEATSVDLDAGEVEFLDQHAGSIERISFDQLMLATGGEPVRPDLPGIDLPFIHGVQSLDDAQALLALASEACRRVVIVGGGYIGLEMAEAYVERGCTATVVEKGPQPLGVVDVDFGARVRPSSSSSASASRPVRDSPRTSASSWRRAARFASTNARRRAPTACGRRATARRPPTSSPARRCTSLSGPTPTSTVGLPASTCPAATPALPGCWARRSPSCARWRSP